MSGSIGKQAVIVGAGMGGLAAACALADHFDRVVLLERDALPANAAYRAGTPQARHVHMLLVGGQQALSDLCPGFESDLLAGGAVPLALGLDIRRERAGFDPCFPRRDLGGVAYAMSRALIEHTLRRRVLACNNVVVRERCRVREFIASDDGSSVTGVRFDNAAGADETLAAELAIDASGRGVYTTALLEALGRPLAPETSIGMDIAYATAVYAVPADAPVEWKGVITFPQIPASSHGGLLAPLEGGRWIVTLAAMHGEQPPADDAGFLDFARNLRTPTIYNAIRGARRLGPIERYGLAASVRRHYDRLADFPRGLLPFGDSICRFNPLWGQGMSVAAQEARLLRGLLAEAARGDAPLANLAAPFFAGAAALIETPWLMAAVPDLIHPKTRGERPPDFEMRLRFGAALTRLAARDAAVDKLMTEVAHLVRPQSAYRDPALLQRVQAEMAVMAGG